MTEVFRNKFPLGKDAQELLSRDSQSTLELVVFAQLRKSASIAGSVKLEFCGNNTSLTYLKFRG